MHNKKSGSRTLLLSVLMSAPGPLVMGLGLLAGRSATQIADFVRRSAELLAIVISFVVYQITTKDGVCDEAKRVRMERRSNAFVGSMMCLGGTIMALLAVFSDKTDPGNVIPGLAIAVLGVIANTAFWVKYTHLNKVSPNAILQVQSRLYRAKSLVDACVTAALLSVVLAPGSVFSVRLDFTGSLVVALYLIHCGLRTIREAASSKP